MAAEVPPPAAPPADVDLADYKRGVEVARQGEPFYALLTAALLVADSHNALAMRRAFPAEVRCIDWRYNAPGGLLPGETSADGVRLTADGKQLVDAKTGDLLRQL